MATVVCKDRQKVGSVVEICRKIGRHGCTTRAQPRQAASQLDFTLFTTFAALVLVLFLLNLCTVLLQSPAKLCTMFSMRAGPYAVL
jgi:hypothetical protein